MERLVDRGHVHVRPHIGRTGVAVFATALTLALGAADRTPLAAAMTDPSTADAIEAPAIAWLNDAAPIPGPVMPTAAPAVVIVPAIAPAVAHEESELVLASWYGPGFYGNRLPCWRWLQANKLPIALAPETWGVAHKTLPCGTPITITHRGLSVTVPVVDRGPYVAGRSLDLTLAVRVALACTDLCTVRMQARD